MSKFNLQEFLVATNSEVSNDGPVDQKLYNVKKKNTKKFQVLADQGENILPNGTRIWKLNRFMHNENGPALITPNGSKIYYINGIKITDSNDIELFPLTDESKLYLKLKYGC